jgi:hypothetical protein
MTVPRTLRWPVLAALALAALALLVSACKGGGGSSPDGGQVCDFGESVSLGEGDLFPVINNSSLAVGPNRLSLAFFDEDDAPVQDARVSLRICDLTGDEPLLASETDASYVPVELFYVDEQSGQEKRIVGSGGVYIANVDFDVAGDWGLEATVRVDDEEFGPLPFTFSVLEESPEPGIGDPAPPSEQLLLSDVDDISEIDSSFPPHPEMHTITVADALELDKPIVLFIGTPAFCESRTCGPVMETVMDSLYERYTEAATFIHVEPFQLKELREGTAKIPVQTTEDWGLRSEPWIFVISQSGLIAGKFEGVTGVEEVEAVLRDLLEGPGA